VRLVQPQGRLCWSSVAVAVTLSAPATVTALAQSSTPTFPLVCDVTAYAPTGGVTARVSGDVLLVQWPGAEDERLRLGLSIVDGRPTIAQLAIQGEGGPWTTVATDASIEFKITEGLRRISNQQLDPLRDLGVELTQDVVDMHKWDAFWDAPLDLRAEVGGSGPPAAGVAEQPGLPRSPDEVRRADAVYDAEECVVATDGARLVITFPGVRLGSFSGEFVLTVYEGTNLIRVETVASTDLPSVAYKYDVGLTGLDLEGSRVAWRDIANEMQSYSLRGPTDSAHVVLRAANRLVVAETNGGAIAAFPPPHTFFWAREFEINVGNNWYRKDDTDSFSFGIRHGEQEVVERYLANWALHSAPPGSQQHMAGYFYPTLGDASEAFEHALAFTNADVYRPLPGYKVMGSHYHTNMGRQLLASGSMDTRLSDFEALRAAGINIAGPVNYGPGNPMRLEELHWLFKGALRHSDDVFMVMPQMENTNLLGGHWDLLFSHPVYYVDERTPGTPLVTEHAEYGRMYNIGSADDLMTMIEAEHMLVYQPHPRAKGSTGFPDAIANTPHFLSDRYRGAGWRWGMGSDLSEVRLSDFRAIPLLDEMNNWIAQTSLRPKYLLANTETLGKSPGDDIYANGPVSYLRIGELPEPGDYAPIIDALMGGNYFVTSGEVLIPSHRYEGGGGDTTLTAEVQWTFPLDFVELVYGDGETTTTQVVPTKDLPPFSMHTFTIPFDATGQAWVRFAAWDSAGNGAMTMPIRLGER
jgi:hypothetical protein